MIFISLFTERRQIAEITPLLWPADKFFLPEGEPKRPCYRSVGFWWVIMVIIYAIVYIIFS